MSGAWSHPNPQHCVIDQRLTREEIETLDSILADPARWPATVWGLLGKPRKLTPASRRFGALEMGLNWLEKHSHADITKLELAHHYRQHVPLIETSLLAYAQAATGRDQPTGPEAVLEFYIRGIQLGLRSFEALNNRIDLMEASGDEVPLELLLSLAGMGARLSSSAATLSRRSPLEVAAGNQGFRRGVPSKRMGHSRIREIDGVAMPVHDEGPADREDYAARVALEGQDALT